MNSHRNSRLPIKQERKSSRSSSTSTAKKSTLSVHQTPLSSKRSRSVSASARRTPLTPMRIKKKETRPIHEKRWQAETLLIVEEFFRNQPESQNILVKGKSIRPITLNMFVELVNIVLSKIDAKFADLTMTNYVDLLPKYLNFFQYPSPVTAATLKTVNTLHAWPHVLGILLFLIQIKNCLDSFPIKEMLDFLPPNATNERRANKFIRFKLLALYDRFENQQEDQDVTKLFETKLREIYQHPEIQMQEVKHEIDKQNELFKHYEEIAKEENTKIEEEKKRLNDLNETMNDYKIKIEKLMENTEHVEKKSLQNENILEEINMQIETMNEENNQLEAEIKNQPVTRQELDKCLRKIEDVENKKELTLDQINHCQGLSYEKDLKLSQLKLNWEKKIHMHNKHLTELQLDNPELKELILPEKISIHSVSDVIKLMEKKLQKKGKISKVLDENINKLEMILKEKEELYDEEQNKYEEIKKKNDTERDALERIKLEYKEYLQNTDQKNNEKQTILDDLKLTLSTLQNVSDTKRNELEELSKKYMNLKEHMDEETKNNITRFQHFNETLVQGLVPKYRKIVNEDLYKIVNEKLKKKEEKK